MFRCDENILKIKCCKDDKRICIVCMFETLMSTNHRISGN
jgi:hypothetical protein